MNDDLDYLSWWNGLDEIWRELLKSEIIIKTSVIRIKSIAQKELSKEETLLLKFKDNFERNKAEVKIESIKYITTSYLKNSI